MKILDQVLSVSIKLIFAIGLAFATFCGGLYLGHSIGVETLEISIALSYLDGWFDAIDHLRVVNSSTI